MEMYFRTKDAAEAAKKGEKDKIVKVRLLGEMCGYLTKEEFEDCKRNKACTFEKKARKDGSLPRLGIEPEEKVPEEVLNFIRNLLS